MDDKVKKFIISLSVLLVLIIIITLVCIYDISIGPLKIVSIKTLLGQYGQITLANSNLSDQQSKYTAALNSLDTSKSNFSKQKAQYDAISDTTIGIIKDATTSEKYDIEYVWVKLGNYAKQNNLSIVLLEPGATSSSTSTDTTSTNSTQTTNTTQNNTNTTNNNTTNGTVSTQQADSSASSSTATTNASSSTQNTISSDSSNNTNNTNSTNTSGSTTNSLQNTTSSTSTSSNTLNIQVTGNYMNLSSFIFELENDTDLRFKLDNISMEYVGNNNIKATFSVKNITVIK